jgi:anaerobic magnesium-protoporphyrin IX monomethyl ester cyclase
MSVDVSAPDACLDLLLIYPPWAVSEERGNSLMNCLPPLGILSIAAYVESRGYHVGVLDVHAEKLVDTDVVAHLRATRPRVVGISVLTNMAVPAHCIARLCKQTVPGCIVVCGGAHAEAMPESMLANSAIDAVVRGDGEEAALEIVEGKRFEDIPGLTYRTTADGVTHNRPRPLRMDLDSYPMPAYHLVNFAHYFPAVGTYRNLPAMNALMTRGCPGKCTFCNSAFTTLRSHSAAKMVAEVKRLRYRYGIRQIQFYDDTFTVAKQTVVEFCQRMIAEKVDVTWIAFIRGDCFSRELARLMKAAGCHQVLVGIESGDEQIMRNIGKPIDKKRYREAVRIAHECGIEVRGSFIIGNVGDTWETMQASVDFAKDLDLDLFQLNISTPYPGTQLYEYAVKTGTLISKKWSEYGQHTVLVRLDNLTADQIYAFERHAFRSFYLRPRIILRHLRRVTRLRHLRDLITTFVAIIRGKMEYRNPQWKRWNDLTEEQFQDLPIASPALPRLTFKLRQEPIPEAPVTILGRAELAS